MKNKVEVKKEIIYLFLVILLTVYFAYSTHTPNSIYILSGALGNILILTWFTTAFVRYSGRRISQYSEVIQRISLKERFFTYFILPLLFYNSLLAYVYFNTSFTMDLVLIAISSILLFILFLNVKSSFKKVYSIEVHTRAVFDFLCIASMYMFLSVIVRLGLSMWLSLLIIGISALIFLWSDIKIHRKESISAFIVSIVSTAFIIFVTGLFFNTNIFVVPAIGTLAFYLILSLWNVRFSGKLKFTDYLPPFIYTILALILILNL